MSVSSVSAEVLSVGALHALIRATYSRSCSLTTVWSVQMEWQYKDQPETRYTSNIAYSTNWEIHIPSPQENEFSRFTYTPSSYVKLRPDQAYDYRIKVRWREWEDYVGGTTNVGGTTYSGWGTFETVSNIGFNLAVENVTMEQIYMSGHLTLTDELLYGSTWQFKRVDSYPDEIINGLPNCSSGSIGGCNSTLTSGFENKKVRRTEWGADPPLIANERVWVRLDIFQYRGTIPIHSDWIEVFIGPPQIETLPATEIGNVIATINGKVTPGTVGKLTSVGFKWGKKGEEHEEIELGLPGENYFDASLVDLEIETDYEFQAYAKFLSGGETYTIYGEWLEFTTTAIVPTVLTLIATDLETLSATGNGEIISIGDLEEFCKSRGFEVKHDFVGTLKEYNAWKNHEFFGDIILNTFTGKWEGTLIKTFEESGEFGLGLFDLPLTDLVCEKDYFYRAKAENEAGWGYGEWLEFESKALLERGACVIGIFTIMLCAYIEPIPAGSTIKRRGFRWSRYPEADTYDIHEDGDFNASAIAGPTSVQFINSGDDTVYDTIYVASGGLITAGFVEGQILNISSDGAISSENERTFRIISVTDNTITVNTRNTLVSETVAQTTLKEYFWLFIVDLDSETSYYSVAYAVIEDSEGNQTYVEQDSALEQTTLENIFEFEGYDKVEFYKKEREQNYRKITRKVFRELVAESQYIELAGGRRFLEINNHLIQDKIDANTVGTNYVDRFKYIKSKMEIQYPTPAPLQREDTIDVGFGRIRFKKDDMGVVNFMPDGEGLMLFRYRMIMIIRKKNMDYSISQNDINYLAMMELEEA